MVAVCVELRCSEGATVMLQVAGAVVVVVVAGALVVEVVGLAGLAVVGVAPGDTWGAERAAVGAGLLEDLTLGAGVAGATPALRVGACAGAVEVVVVGAAAVVGAAPGEPLDAAGAPE